MIILSLRFLALTFDVAGKLALAIMALMVHNRIVMEKRIDKKIIMEMKREKRIAYLAVILILIAYVIEIFI